MKLKGKDLRLIPGGITVFRFVPFSKVEKTSLRDREDQLLLSIRRRLVDLRKAIYQANGVQGADPVSIARQLECEGDWGFSEEELEVLTLVLEQVIEEERLTPTASHNVYFNGDQYGVTLHDFEDCLGRLRDEIRAIG